MSIERLIESIGESKESLKRYLLEEIEEFLEAEGPEHQEEEFGDVLFALKAMAWAHSGKHYALQADAYEPKIKKRLRSFAAISRNPKVYRPESIFEMQFGVIHFAFGQFAGQWYQFDPLLNGTVAEIHLLTDAPFHREGQFTNHCILTFDDTDGIKYDILDSASDQTQGNTVRCRIPNFMFSLAKKELAFDAFGEFLTLQVLAALDGLQFAPGAIAHFHSWECGFLATSEAFLTRINAFKTIFSPYLTVGRLKALVDSSDGHGWTMSPREMVVASVYEQKLSAASMRVVLESAKDREFFATWVHSDKLDVRSFARDEFASFESDPPTETELSFIAGGRPVREKGFVELCREFALVRDWADTKGLQITLTIFCRERRVGKGAEYIAEIEQTIVDHSLENVVRVEPKVALPLLRKRIAEASALIVPSLYDPFSLMPTYAVEGRRPAFVSRHAGVCENLKSREFTFDPLAQGELSRVITSWHEKCPKFEYEACYPSYRDLYLTNVTPQPWT